MRSNTLIILTPEGISFTQHLAGPVTRFLAFAIDLAGIALAASILSQVLLLAAFVNADFALAARTLSYFVVTIGYSILLESIWRGQTLGKRALKIRVIDAEGFRLRPSQIVIRNLLRVVDLLPAFYAVGGLCCALSSKYQRLGDIAGNTVVIYTNSEKITDIELLFIGSYNSLRNHAHLAAQLRKSISPGEARLALEAVASRAELEPSSRLELYRQVAQRLHLLVSLPEETLEGMTDEQYVRNIVDLIYRPTL